MQTPAKVSAGWETGVSRISWAWSIFIQNRAVPAFICHQWNINMNPLSRIDFDVRSDGLFRKRETPSSREVCLSSTKFFPDCGQKS